jgi:hypothetical protein
MAGQREIQVLKPVFDCENHDKNEASFSESAGATD